MNLSCDPQMYLMFLIVFVKLLSLSSSSASANASCSSSSFSRYIGYILRGFLLGEVNVGDVMECKKRCVISANCKSVNLLANGNGTFICQLNKGLKETGVREQFVQHRSGEYYGLKEKRLCKSDGNSCDNVSPWHAFNQSYFQYVRTEALHFDAGKHCEEQNGWLVSISSEDERTFLVETFILVDNAGTSCVHIGMNDIAEENVFVWEDASPVTYLRFSANEPNDENEQDCIALWKFNGLFTDVSCNTPYFYICETDYSSLNSIRLN